MPNYFDTCSYLRPDRGHAVSQLLIFLKVKDYKHENINLLELEKSYRILQSIKGIFDWMLIANQ